jgi:hypothetical protein
VGELLLLRFLHDVAARLDSPAELEVILAGTHIATNSESAATGKSDAAL